MSDAKAGQVMFMADDCHTVFIRGHVPMSDAKAAIVEYFQCAATNAKNWTMRHVYARTKKPTREEMDTFDLDGQYERLTVECDAGSRGAFPATLVDVLRYDALYPGPDTGERSWR